MKAIYVLIVYMLCSHLLNAQRVKILIVDLDTLHSQSIRFQGEESKRKWLSAKSSELLAVKIQNGNPLKYKYSINNKPLTFFMDPEKLNENSVIKNNTEEKAKEKYGPDVYSDLPKKNKELEETLEKLEGNISGFELECMNRQSLGEQFKKQRDKLYLLLHDAEYAAKANEMCFLEGISKYRDRLTEDERTKAAVDIKNNITKSEEMLKAFKSKYFVIMDTYTLPLDSQGKNIDAVEFTIKRTDKITNQEDQDFEGKYKIWIKGGLKIDISAGIFLTSLFNDEFETKDGTDADHKLIFQKNRGKYDFAFGSTVNTGFRINSWIQPNVNFGFIFTQNQKFQLALGAGIVLGREERWILSGGLSMGVVDRLAGGYETGKQYSLGADGEVPIVKQFKFGHFFGITYNLSKVNTITFK